MRWRLVIVLVVAVTSVGVRATSIYLRYLSTELSSTPPYKTRVHEGQLLIDRVNPQAECYRGWADPSRPMRGDRILEVYDHRGSGGPVRGLFDYGLYLRPINVEDRWTLVVGRQTPAGVQHLPLAMPPSVPIQWTPAEWVLNLSADFYLPFLATVAGLLIGLLRWRDGQAWLASLLFLALGLSVVPSLAQFPPGWRVVALFLQLSSAHLLPYLVFRFFLRFPSRSPVDRAIPWLNSLFATVAVCGWAIHLVYDFSVHLSLARAAAIDAVLAAAGMGPRTVDTTLTGFAGLMLITALLSVVLNAREAPEGHERRRLRVIAAGAVAGLLPASLIFALASAGVMVPIGLAVAALLLAGLFPMSFAYAVVRHRVFGVRVIVRRGLTHALVSRGFLLAEAALIFLALLAGAGKILEGVEPRPSPAVSTAGTAVATFMLTLGMRRVNQRVLPVIDRRFFRDAYDGRRILNDLSRAVRRMASHPEQLLAHASQEVMAALYPQTLSVFIAPEACPGLSPAAGDFRAYCELDLGPEARKRFALQVDQRAGSGHGDVRGSSRFHVTRLPLGRHLAASAAGEPEALEVEAVEARQSMPRREQAPDVDAALDESALYERFDARLVVPLVTAGRVIGFLLLGEKRSEEPYSREDKELLLTVAEQMAIALDYAQLIGQAAEQAALRREVQIAQQVQQQLFPHERPALRSLRYAGLCRAARGVGGDFYDFLPLAGGQLGLALADIAGKGLPAALLMASLQALLRSHAPTHAHALEELARELNRHLVETSDGARFATLFFGVYDDRTRCLEYVNAGHLPPLVLRREADGLSVSRLESGGIVLGLFPDQEYSRGCARLEPGDRLLVFSDGVTEATDADGDMFGEQRLVSMAAAYGEADIERLPEHVMAEVSRFVGALAQQDDITVIAAQVL